MGLLDDIFDSFNKSSFEKGKEDALDGKNNILAYGSDEEYRKGHDSGRGIRDGSKAEGEYADHPVSGVLKRIIDEGTNKLGNSEEYGQGYDKGAAGGRRSDVSPDPNNHVTNALANSSDVTAVSERSSDVLHHKVSGSAGGYLLAVPFLAWFSIVVWFSQKMESVWHWGWFWWIPMIVGGIVIGFIYCIVYLVRDRSHSKANHDQK